MTVIDDRRGGTKSPRPWPLGASIGLVVAQMVSSCSSPTTPTTTPAPTAAILTVSGNALLSGVGQTSQLTATTSAGVVVTSGIAWQTGAISVATVSASGLVTATGSGTTTITATTTTPLAGGRVTVFVGQPGAPTTTISACQTIQKSGPYVLGNDLLQTGGTCLQLTSVGAVQLDCRGHTISGLSLSTVNTIAISNCSVAGAVTMTNAANVTVTNGSVTAGLAVTTSTSVVVSNTVINAAQEPVTVTNGTNVQLIQDTVTSAFGAGGVLLLNGTNNQVVQTTITGGYDGGPSPVGTDDGILLTNETGDTIMANVVSGFFDTAVEGVARVANATVANNKFSNIGASAIGTYYCTNWTNNIIRGNAVQQAPSLLLVNDEGGSFCTTPPPVFSGNQFIGNQFRSPITGFQGSPFPAPRMVVIFVPGTAAGNVLQNNDFGTNDGPLLEPLTAFTDGGGNVCGPLNPSLSNFVCTGSSTTSAHVSSDPHVLLRRPPRPPK